MQQYSFITKLGYSPLEEPQEGAEFVTIKVLNKCNKQTILKISNHFEQTKKVLDLQKALKQKYAEYGWEYSMEIIAIHYQSNFIIIEEEQADSDLQDYPITQGQLRQLILDLTRQIWVLHKEFKYAHLDIKPQNILVHKGHFILIDFGLSEYHPNFFINYDHFIAPLQNNTGTQMYMCPQRLNKLMGSSLQSSSSCRISQDIEYVYNPFKSDLYSLGLVILNAIMKIKEYSVAQINDLFLYYRNDNQFNQIVNQCTYHFHAHNLFIFKDQLYQLKPIVQMLVQDQEQQRISTFQLALYIDPQQTVFNPLFNIFLPIIKQKNVSIIDNQVFANESLIFEGIWKDNRPTEGRYYIEGQLVFKGKIENILGEEDNLEQLKGLFQDQIEFKKGKYEFYGKKLYAEYHENNYDKIVFDLLRINDRELNQFVILQILTHFRYKNYSSQSIKIKNQIYTDIIQCTINFNQDINIDIQINDKLSINQQKQPNLVQSQILSQKKQLQTSSMYSSQDLSVIDQTNLMDILLSSFQFNKLRNVTFDNIQLNLQNLMTVSGEQYMIPLDQFKLKNIQSLNDEQLSQLFTFQSFLKLSNLKIVNCNFGTKCQSELSRNTLLHSLKKLTLKKQTFDFVSEINLKISQLISLELTRFGNDETIQSLIKQVNSFRYLRILILNRGEITNKGISILSNSQLGTRIQKLSLAYNHQITQISSIQGLQIRELNLSNLQSVEESEMVDFLINIKKNMREVKKLNLQYVCNINYKFCLSFIIDLLITDQRVKQQKKDLVEQFYESQFKEEDDIVVQKDSLDLMSKNLLITLRQLIKEYFDENYQSFKIDCQLDKNKQKCVIDLNDLNVESLEINQSEQYHLKEIWKWRMNVDQDLRGVIQINKLVLNKNWRQILIRLQENKVKIRKLRIVCGISSGHDVTISLMDQYLDFALIIDIARYLQRIRKDQNQLTDR